MRKGKKKRDFTRSLVLELYCLCCITRPPSLGCSLLTHHRHAHAPPLLPPPTLAPSLQSVPGAAALHGAGPVKLLPGRGQGPSGARVCPAGWPGEVLRILPTHEQGEPACMLSGSLVVMGVVRALPSRTCALARCLDCCSTSPALAHPTGEPARRCCPRCWRACCR